MSENNLETKNGKESLNQKIENMKGSLEEMKDKDIFKSSDIFKIVVESLAKKDIRLPHPGIYSITHMHVGGLKKLYRYILVKFKGEKHNTLMYFNEKNNEVLLRVGADDTYTLTGEDAYNYREKYLDYALQFLEEEKAILKESSKLGKSRLEKLGI